LLRACLFAFILSIAAVLIYSLQRRELRHEHQKFKFLVQEKIDELTEANTLLHQEIENRKNVQKSLSYAIEEWHNTFDVISSPVIILDNEFIALKGNKAAIRLFGGEKAILGKKSHELLELEMSSFAKHIQDGSTMSLTGNEFEIEHKTLKKILHASCVPITYQNEVAGYVLTTMDKTLQRELETQLIQAQKMEAIATLAGGIAHDFNNILGAILGNADLILYQIPKKIDENELNIPAKQGISMAEIESHLFSIKKAGERAKALVRQILAFSRSTESMLQEIDITPIVKEAIKLLRASLPATIEIHSNVAPDLCYVNADPTQIHQILMNLGTNAAQAMEKVGGILDISLWETVIGQESLKRYHGLRQGKYLVLTVKDTGHGMSKSIQSQIFDPFFSTRGVGKGTGMGLSVIHGIVTAHGGIIDVQSEVGKGSVFTVFIPARERMEDSSQNVMVAMPGGAETILFVDDEEEIVKMRTRMLEYLGYKVISATSGKQALTLIQEGGEQVDIVITDLTMPKMTGIQLAAEIRKIFTEIPVILCSGYSETVVPEEAEKAGVKKFMAKPLEMRALANAIREVINKQE
jgi:signal transduction histidine kinase/ActR/RegA family two-component response regulator